MRVVVQRVKRAEVKVAEKVTGQIGVGLLVLAGFEKADQEGDLDWMAQKRQSGPSPRHDQRDASPQ